MGFTTCQLHIKCFLCAMLLLLPCQYVVSQNISPISSGEKPVTIEATDLLVLVDSTNSFTALEVADSNQNHDWQIASNVRIKPIGSRLLFVTIPIEIWLGLPILDELS